MQFLPALRKYLTESGVIYTVRKYNSSPWDKMHAGQVRVVGVSNCLRKPLGEVFLKTELEKYVSQSGFATMDEWWAAIRRFIPINARMFLYEVSLQGREVC